MVSLSDATPNIVELAEYGNNSLSEGEEMFLNS